MPRPVRPGKLPLVAGGEMAVGQTCVLAQIVGMLRNPVLREWDLPADLRAAPEILRRSCSMRASPKCAMTS